MDAILDRLHSRLSHLLNRPPIDSDFLELTCTQELVFLNVLSSQETFPHAVMEGLRLLFRLFRLLMRLTTASSLLTTL